jgi:hypothetical protein
MGSCEKRSRSTTGRRRSCARSDARPTSTHASPRPARSSRPRSSRSSTRRRAVRGHARRSGGRARHSRPRHLAGAARSGLDGAEAVDAVSEMVAALVTRSSASNSKRRRDWFLPTRTTKKTSNSPTSEGPSLGSTRSAPQASTRRLALRHPSLNRRRPRAVGRRVAADARQRSSLPRSAAGHSQRAGGSTARANALPHSSAHDNHSHRRSKSAPTGSAAPSAGARPSRRGLRRVSRTSSPQLPPIAPSTRRKIMFSPLRSTP